LIGNETAYDYHDRRTAGVLGGRPNEFDIIHSWPLGSARTLETAKSLGIPTFLERPNSHTASAVDAVEHASAELGIPVAPTNSHARSARRIAREELEYTLASRILCPSEFVYDSFREKGFSDTQLARHRYGYDPTYCSAQGRKIGNAPFNVCFVGRGEPRKGLHFALRAWFTSGSAEAGGEFVLAGDIEPAYRKLLRPYLAHRSVREIGFVADPASIMRAADVLILPSVEEGSALVTYEARACGAILAVSDRSGAFHCDDGVNAMIHRAGDVEKLADQLRALRTDSELCELMRTRSLELSSELTWDKSGEVLAEIYGGASARA